MKTIKQIAIIVVLLLASFSISAQSTVVKDTTVFFNQKKIAISDSLDQVKVKVYRIDETEYKQIYEGIYTDDQTFERYSVVSQIGFEFPFGKKKQKSKLTGHFTGFGFGAFYTHKNFEDFGDAAGMKTTFSNEIFFNPIGYTLPVVNRYFGIVTGIGMTWRNIHLGNNTHLTNNGDITVVEPAPAGINYYYSRLRMYDLNMPLYLELHPFGNNKFYLMGGMLFGVNTYNSYKVKYTNENGKKIKDVLGKDYNINPFSASWLVQMGWSNLAVYAKYTPTPLFKNGKGLDLQSFSVGINLTF